MRKIQPAVSDLREIGRLFARLADRLDDIAPTIHQTLRPIDKATLLLAFFRAMHRELGEGGLFRATAIIIMLELFLAHSDRRLPSITEISYAAFIPPTTALRFFEALASEGLIARRPDPHDRRRTSLELTPKGLDCIQRLLSR